MKSPMICSVTMAAALVIGLSPVALALDKVPVMSLDLARKIAAGCEAKAKEMNWKMNISVVAVVPTRFENGRCLPGQWRDCPSSQTRRRFRAPLVTEQRLTVDPGGRYQACAVPGLIAFAGGLPIMTEDKVHIGGIGVSGGTSDQDETCAQAGIDAAKDGLK